ncbi:MAG: hypothetical protein JWP55_3524 [Mycobacterium sp.]|nr:hypothetical protein [Mycobacterium sp.]
MVPGQPYTPEDGAGDQHGDASECPDQDATKPLAWRRERSAELRGLGRRFARDDLASDGLRRIGRNRWVGADLRRDRVSRRGGHFDGAVVAIGRLLGQPGGDHVIQRGRDGVTVLGGFGWRHHHVAHRDLLERGAGERQLAGQAFVEHAGEGVHVAAGSDLAVAESFGAM